MFNIYATIIFFPLELYTGIIYKTAMALGKTFEDIGGFKFTSPLKVILSPVSGPIAGIIENHYVLLIFSMFCLFFSMTRILHNIKGIVVEKI